MWRGLFDVRPGEVLGVGASCPFLAGVVVVARVGLGLRRAGHRVLAAAMLGVGGARVLGRLWGHRNKCRSVLDISVGGKSHGRY